MNPELWRERISEKLFNAVQAAHHFGVEGDVAEFGTMTGRTAEVLAQALAACDSQCKDHIAKEFGGRAKHLYLFDSFRGLPPAADPADADSLHVTSGIWAAGTMTGLSPEGLAALVQKSLPAGRVHLHEGWFKDTVASLPADTRFAVAHLDCDLYASTRDVLGGLFSRGLLSEGAALLFDDWDANRSAPARGQRLAWAECVREFGVEFSDHGEYGLGGHKFILHVYRTPACGGGVLPVK